VAQVEQQQDTERGVWLTTWRAFLIILFCGVTLGLLPL
jgi:hypothetical protein